MRLFVTGPTGSGKTTLAAALARRLGRQVAMPLHSLDDLHWVRHPSGDRRRAPSERSALLERLVQGEHWVIEGVQFKWADGALERADLIVVLDLPRWRNTVRILRRFAGRRLSSVPNPRGTLAALREEMRWSADYYGHERRMLFDTLARWPDRILVVRGRRDMPAVDQALSAITGGWPSGTDPDGGREGRAG